MRNERELSSVKIIDISDIDKSQIKERQKNHKSSIRKNLDDEKGSRSNSRLHFSKNPILFDPRNLHSGIKEGSTHNHFAKDKVLESFKNEDHIELTESENYD